jgi:predicted kinase
MRRRSRRAPNTSESTGKTGAELPSNQPAPLVPYYAEDSAAGARTEEHRPRDARPQESRQESRRDPRHEQRQDQRHAQHPRGPRPESRPGPRTVPAESRNPPAAQQWNEPPGSGRLEVETQPDMPGAPLPESGQERTPQQPKGYVVLAIGLPGSGKTTWFGRRGVTPLSSDLLRSILFDDVEEQRYQGLVFSTLRSLLLARLKARMPWNYVDATNLSPHERRQWIKMAKSFGYEVQAVFFDVPLEVCLERNRQRDRSVSEDVMRRMAEKLKPPVFEEGFAKITVVRVKSAG